MISLSKVPVLSYFTENHLEHFKDSRYLRPITSQAAYHTARLQNYLEGCVRACVCAAMHAGFMFFEFPTGSASTVNDVNDGNQLCTSDNNNHQ
jgi:hypothetical protein